MNQPGAPPPLPGPAGTGVSMEEAAAEGAEGGGGPPSSEGRGSMMVVTRPASSQAMPTQAPPQGEGAEGGQPASAARRPSWPKTADARARRAAASVAADRF
jgi:hypothetical protein